MHILTTNGWQDYELLDSGNGKRLERFGTITLIRPDPQVIWKPNFDQSYWQNTVDALFERTSGEKGKWLKIKPIPNKWLLRYQNISFYAELTPFKHTGVFPEQSIHWDWMKKIIEENKRTLNILNLFGYSGIASLIAAAAGAKVTHIDASYPTIGWARENQKASGLESKSIRWILDDAVKFVGREIKRGVKYDGIIMDPPVYGHGPKGERWSFNESYPKLLELCAQILTANPAFIISNAYAVSTSSVTLYNLFEDYFRFLGGNIEYGELALEEKNRKRLLSTGLFVRWSM